MERLPGERDGDLSFATWFNPSAGQEHPTLDALPTSDVIVSYFRGTTLGNAAASCVGKQMDYKGKLATDGSFTFDTQIVPNAFGLEWGRQLTAGIRNDVAATNGTGIQSGTAASTTFGFQAYIHLFAFTGTSCNIKLQESNDNGGADPYADTTNGSSGALVAPAALRISAPNNQTVKQWVRVVTIGTFTVCSFAVVFARNLSAVVF